MSFTVYYRSTREVLKKEAKKIQQEVQEKNRGHTWLHCEPVCFSMDEQGHLFGGSKPNFEPHPEDVADAQNSELADGTIRDVLAILCELSQEYQVPWEISHDLSDGPIGLIQDGICDEEVISQIETFADLGDILGELGLDEDI